MTQPLAQKEITRFQADILSWYAQHKRDLPWRSTRDPYKILVSEVMSQQTQISRVVPKYEAWVTAFPTVDSLANASVRDVLMLWSGLGYNRRAMYLKKCAEVISSKARNPDGILKPAYSQTRQVLDDKYWFWPQTEKELMKLPGIGKYTARALLCFAFDKQVAVVDTNIKKVILTQFVKKEYLPEKEIEHIADLLLPKGKAYEWNQALMDYAAAKLKKEKIALPKQSKFKDSDRYLRGQILKHLLAAGSVTAEELTELFGRQGVSVHKERLDNVLTRLLKERFISQQGNVFLIV